MAGLDLAAAAGHIYTQLAATPALAGLTIVEGVAPASVACPYIRFEYLSGVGRLVLGTGATYIMGKPQYTVRVIAKDQPYSALDSYVQGIYTALHVLHPGDLADEWVLLPNRNPVFNGRTPVETMTRGGIPAMLAVRALLDGRRGGL